MICHPVEGMLIECDVKTVTKAGIHAVVKTDDDVIPVTVFVARDHNYNDAYFATIKENMKITTRLRIKFVNYFEVTLMKEFYFP
jgi:hypothetical protein